MNEYKEAFDELQKKDSFRGQQWFGERRRLVDEYSWAIPNEQAIIYLAEFDHLIEVGAGNGYWAKCINDAGGNVEATDIDPPEETYTEVEPVNIINIDMEGAAVLTVWPPHDEYMAGKIPLDNPNHILYVGEPEGGCTADDKFFERLEQAYGLVAKIEIPSYAGIHDNLFHYIRKT